MWASYLQGARYELLLADLWPCCKVRMRRYWGVSPSPFFFFFFLWKIISVHLCSQCLILTWYFLQLLRKCPERRLGAGEKDAEEIKIQAFFKVGTHFIPPPHLLCLSWEWYTFCWYGGIFPISHQWDFSGSFYCTWVLYSRMFFMFEMTSPKSVFWDLTDLIALRTGLFLIVLLLGTKLSTLWAINISFHK